MNQKRFTFNKPINYRLESIQEETFGKKNYSLNSYYDSNVNLNYHYNNSNSIYSKRKPSSYLQRQNQILQEPTIIVQSLININDSEIFENFIKFGKILKIFKEDKLKIYKIIYKERNSISYALDYFYQKKINREIIDFKVDEYREDSINNLKFENLIFSNGNFFTEKELKNHRRTFFDSDIRGEKFNLESAFKYKSKK
jgi:hypothetical protein